MHSNTKGTRGIGLLVGVAAIWFSLVLTLPTAQAQFVCGGSPTGTAPVDGDSSTATGFASVACGSDSNANGIGTVAVGANAGALGSGSIAIGQTAGQNPDPGNLGNNSGNIAVGSGSGGSVTGQQNTAVGAGSGGLVQGDSNSAFGVVAGIGVTGDSNSAFGNNAGRFITGNNNIAVGREAGSGAFNNPLAVNNTVAIGSNATARADGAIAIGNGAQATRVNQFAFGTLASTYTMAGIASADSRAAQTGPVQVVTSDASGNLATASAASLGLASSADLGAINAQLAIDRTEARQGIAAAMALTTAPMPSRGGRTSWAVNAATFRGESAGGFSLAHRLDVAVPLAITGGYAFGGGNSHGGRIGLQGEF
jgi:autotransporter adhesin